MRFCILASGSSGNSALVVTEGSRVLLDAGFSARRLAALLHAAGETIAALDAVFVTHEHSDHSSGIESLKKFPHLKFFANAATARAVQKTLTWAPSWQIFDTGSSFRFRDLEVETFAVPHDAHDPVGYRFASGSDGDLFAPLRRLAWVTDLGHAPPHLQERLRDCDVVAIESNHCPQLLQADHRRSWSTKQRISGRHGHLSNEATRELLASVASPRWQRVYLTHLSRDCNSLAAVEASLAGLRATLRCDFAIVGHGEGTPFFELS